MTDSKRRKRTPSQATTGVLPSPSSLVSHPEPRTPEERKLLEATLRRERALLWTDDRPFSIWKA
ncbi:MAG TPA: hypothetical protein VKT82_12070 [Ktedonobacterales bacterium]|nr:hypothetical protein [Ktedonobacterales bacterium]